MAGSETRGQRLAALAAGAPSGQSWESLCELLALLSGDELDAALRLCRESVLRWPRDLRRIGYRSEREVTAPWTAALFEGRFDSRLELVGAAVVRHSCEFKEEDSSLYSFEVIGALARRLDSSFAPPDTVLEKDDQFTSAAGCGGGWDHETRGDAQQGLKWHNTTTEHAADYSDAGHMEPYGLAEGRSLRLDRYDRGGGSFNFVASGYAPEIFEVAFAWGALLRLPKGTAVARVETVLASARAPS